MHGQSLVAAIPPSILSDGQAGTPPGTTTIRVVIAAAGSLGEAAAMERAAEPLLGLQVLPLLAELLRLLGIIRCATFCTLLLLVGGAWELAWQEQAISEHELCFLEGCGHGPCLEPGGGTIAL